MLPEFSGVAPPDRGDVQSKEPYCIARDPATSFQFALDDAARDCAEIFILGARHLQATRNGLLSHLPWSVPVAVSSKIYHDVEKISLYCAFVQ
jgi:hypothetical protein